MNTEAIGYDICITTQMEDNNLPLQRSTQRKSMAYISKGVQSAAELKLIVDGDDHLRKLKRRRRLCTWSELPEWQKDNEHIRDGYVRETNSIKETLLSLFYLHNESVNIYSHLLPGVCFLAVVFFHKHAIAKFDTSTWLDYFMINLFFTGAFSCLIMSSTFHCLKSHSSRVSIIGNQLDYLGIVALITTSMLSLMYFGFYDSKVLFYTFSCITTVVGIACTIMTLDSRFRTREWRPYRAVMFVAFGLSGALPVIASCFYYGYVETFQRVQLKWVILEGVLYIFGAFLYDARFPERFAPGVFDIWGHSHQIFHVLVVFGTLCHIKGLVGCYNFVHTTIVNKGSL